MGLQVLAPAAITLMVVVAFYLLRRTSAHAFASVSAVVGVGIFAIGVLYISSWYDGQREGGAAVEGNSLFDAFFFLSAYAGSWLALSASTLVAKTTRMRARRSAKVACAAALFVVTLAIAIPAGMFIAFGVTY